MFDQSISNQHAAFAANVTLRMVGLKPSFCPFPDLKTAIIKTYFYFKTFSYSRDLRQHIEESGHRPQFKCDKCDTVCRSTKKCKVIISF